MVNLGIAPPQPGTDVGKFRVLYGDTSYVALDPPVSGLGDYVELSDDEITLFLEQAVNSVPGAIGWYYLRLSGDAAKVSMSTADYDLKLDSTKRSGDLRAMADFWFDRAAEEDIALGGGDIFEVVGPPLGNRYPSFPEASPYWAQG